MAWTKPGRLAPDYPPEVIAALLLRPLFEFVADYWCYLWCSP
jgi:hypothetical protein